jgi:hypothetical protein
MASSSNIWKETSIKRPWYNSVNQTPASAPYQANFHSVPIAKDNVIIPLSDAFYLLHPFDTDEPVKVVISFQDKLFGTVADRWVTDFNQRFSLRLRIQKSSITGFHILGIGGVDAEQVQANLLRDSPLLFNNIWASVSPFTPSTDIDNPIGLTQLVYISFTHDEAWVEDALEDIFTFEQVGRLVNYRRLSRDNSWFYSILCEYNRNYFVHRIGVPLLTG